MPARQQNNNGHSTYREEGTDTYGVDAHTNTDRQTERQTDRQTDRQAGRQAGRQTDRQTDRGRIAIVRRLFAKTVCGVHTPLARRYSLGSVPATEQLNVRTTRRWRGG